MRLNKKQWVILILCLNFLNVSGCKAEDDKKETYLIDGYWKLISVSSTNRFGVATVSDLSSLYFPAEFYSENNGSFVASCAVSPVGTEWVEGDATHFCYGPKLQLIKYESISYNGNTMTAQRLYYNGSKDTSVYERDTDMVNAKLGNTHGCHFKL